MIIYQFTNKIQFDKLKFKNSSELDKGRLKRASQYLMS